jgi:hypothetical protein
MSGIVRRVVSVLCVLLIAGAAVPARSPADGDPASDVLVGQNVFYPLETVPGFLRHRLNAVVARAHRAGLPIKVALVDRPSDLGVYPSLYGKPQEYASAVLEKEISFRGPQPLLIVMSDGYGVAGLDAPAVKAAAALPTPSGPKGRNLAELIQAATLAVPKLAAADGHPLTGGRRVASTSSSGGGGVGRDALLLILVLAAVLVAGTLVLLRLRQALRAQSQR